MGETRDRLAAEISAHAPELRLDAPMMAAWLDEIALELDRIAAIAVVAAVAWLANVVIAWRG